MLTFIKAVLSSSEFHQFVMGTVQVALGILVHRVSSGTTAPTTQPTNSAVIGGKNDG